MIGTYGNIWKNRQWIYCKLAFQWENDFYIMGKQITRKMLEIMEITESGHHFVGKKHPQFLAKDVIASG